MAERMNMRMRRHLALALIHVGWLYRYNPVRPSKEEQLRYASDIASDPYVGFLGMARAVKLPSVAMLTRRGMP
jgi:hypothetical protein